MSLALKKDDLRDRDWDVLLHSIQRGNCVLLLGPNLDISPNGSGHRNLAQELAQALGETLKDEKGTDVPEGSQLSLVAQIFQNELSRDDLELDVERFYRAHNDALTDSRDEAFDNLASLPFQTIITSRHDKTLEHCLQLNGKAPKNLSYEFNGDRKDILGHLGTTEQPLVYHLYGEYESVDSLVVTENDIIRFLESVVSENPKLPVDLTNHLKDKNFLFVGFGLGDYHLRVLLHVLGVGKSTKSYALETPVMDSLQGGSGSTFDECVLFYRATGYSTLKILDADLGTFLKELREKWDALFPDGGAADQTGGQAEPVQPQADGPKVFISYVAEDKDRAQRITDLLRQEGLDPWLDKEGLRVGSNWSDKLTDTISKDTDFFVVLQSKALSDRLESYVHKEVKLALSRQEMRAGSFIFPVIIDEDANRLEAIDRAKIQSMKVFDIDADVPVLAKEIRREHARQQRR
jgi:hypothetical protein